MIHQIRCIHREKGTPYTLPVPGKTYAEAATKAAAAGHIVEGGAQAPETTPSPVIVRDPDPALMLDELRLHSHLLREMAERSALQQASLLKLTRRTHWPMAVTAVLLTLAAAAAAPIVLGHMGIKPGDAAALRLWDQISGVYFFVLLALFVPWAVVMLAVTLRERLGP